MIECFINANFAKYRTFSRIFYEMISRRNAQYINKSAPEQNTKPYRTCITN